MLLILLILGGCTLLGFRYLGTIGAILGFLVGLFLLAALNAG